MVSSEVLTSSLTFNQIRFRDRTFGIMIDINTKSCPRRPRRNNEVLPFSFPFILFMRISFREDVPLLSYHYTDALQSKNVGKE